MRTLVLGCGEMAQVAIDDLVRRAAFEEVVIGTRRRRAADDFLVTLGDPGPTDVSVHEIDVQHTAELVELMRGCDSVCNLAGPNYLNAVPVAKAAIEARVPMVDVSDDWEATLEILDLHNQAVEAGIPVIVGLGASPGVTNIMARAAANRLDRTNEVHTAWVMRGSDLGGPALARHLLYSLPHRAFVFKDGEMQEVAPFKDGREVLDFPQLGDVEVFHIGHPEPFTLSRYIPGICYADDKATFLPAGVNDIIVELGALVRSGQPVEVDGLPVDAMDYAAERLRRESKAISGMSRTAALRTEVRGELDGRATTIIYSAAGPIGIGTGIPASIGVPTSSSTR
jgi:saccharopine dehydrogenase-like NADP-dependent oxidoreductase